MESQNNITVVIGDETLPEYIIPIVGQIKVYFTLIRSNNLVVKTYLPDGKKKTAASIWKAKYSMQHVDGLLSFDKYLWTLTQNDTISLGITEKIGGDLVTNTKLEDGATGTNLISRSGRFIKFLNETYKYYKETKDFSAFLVDIDFDKKSPSHFKLDTKEEVRAVLIKLAPMLEFVQMLIRPSSSSGIRNSETGEYRNLSKSYHVYILISNTKYIHHFTEYLKRRCWQNNFAYVTTNGAGVTDRYIMDLSVMKTSERLVVESVPITYLPYIKEIEPSSFYGGGILDLEKFENYANEPDYKEELNRQKQLIKGTNDLKISSRKTKNNKSLTPINCIPLSTNNNTSIIISDDTLKKMGYIHHYFKDTTYSKIQEVQNFLDEYVVKAILIFLGYKIEHNLMFKMRVDEKTASASIQRKTALISDFGSNFRGGIVNFIMEVYQLDFITSFRYFKNLFGQNYKIKSKIGALRDPKKFQKCLQTISITF
ncbi:MAG: hypothetical protein KAQ94_06595 [Arcobacteraceae bacterium]|nr:hypothetical protein [Arcobacteraceae bacterium]